MKREYLTYGAKYPWYIQLFFVPTCIMGLHKYQKDVAIVKTDGSVDVKDVCCFCSIIKK